MSADYARSLTDYWSEEPGELSCTVGDIVKIIHKEGRKLLLAENLNTGRKGLLPGYCVESIEVPEVPNVFFSHTEYSGTESGYLTFAKGDIIIGDYGLDDNWWSGRTGRQCGLFPVAWTCRFPAASDQYPEKTRVTFDFKSPISSELPVKTGEIITVLRRRSDGWYEAKSASGMHGAIPDYCVDLASDHGVNKAAPSKPNKTTLATSTSSQPGNLTADKSRLDLMAPHARALYEFDSRISGELKFAANDIIWLQRSVDENWLQGELADGRQGIFPTVYVQIIIGLPDSLRIGSTETSPAMNSLLANQETADISWRSQTTSMATDPGHQLTISGTDCGDTEKFPDIFCESSAALAEDFPPSTYAIVIVSFVARTEEELTIEEGDTVTILTKQGMQWVEAMDDYGTVGFCPTNCLEIIASEPDEVRSRSQMDNSSISSFDSLRRSDGSVSPTLSGETEAMSPEIKRGRSEFNRLHPTVSVLQGHNQERKDQNRTSIADAGKGLDKRKQVIDEIVSTEEDYVNGLTVCLRIMKTNPAPPKEFDLFLALTQLADVIRCAENLLKDLKQAGAGHGRIGECFFRNIKPIRSAYVTYCQNSDMTIESLAKYKDVPELSAYMERKVSDIRLTGVNCFDLAGMLIKPLQRILKYPLLLSELLKETKTSHPDYVFVRDSLNSLTDVAVFLNELKRRKELVLKYRTTERWSDRFSRISLHSLVKKTNRLSLLVSSTMGFTTLIQDPVFQTEERKFQISKRTIKWFLRSVTEFSAQAQVVQTLLTSMAADHARLSQENGSSSSKSFTSAQTAVASHIQNQFIPKIDLHVIQPLEQVLKQYEGPSNLISKRHAKLIDYENAKRKVERTKVDQRTPAMFEEVELAKKVYQALNSQLLEDLPKFNNVICRILQSRVDAFLHFRKMCYFVSSKEVIYGCHQDMDSRRHLSQKLKSALADLKKMDFGATMSLPVVFTRSLPDVSRQDSFRSSLLGDKSDPPTPVSPVHNTSVARSSSVIPDTVIARSAMVSPRPNHRQPTVIPDSELHDNGHPEQNWHLQRSESLRFTNKTAAPIRDSSNTVLRDTSYVATAPAPPVPRRMGGSTKTRYIAGFDFKPNGPYQVPLAVGQEITVLARQDLDGNVEWWYVEDRHGTRGYVPSAYIKEVTGS